MAHEVASSENNTKHDPRMKNAGGYAAFMALVIR
jgi:hypothetical protein